MPLLVSRKHSLSSFWKWFNNLLYRFCFQIFFLLGQGDDGIIGSPGKTGQIGRRVKGFCFSIIKKDVFNSIDPRGGIYCFWYCLLKVCFTLFKKTGEERKGHNERDTRRKRRKGWHGCLTHCLVGGELLCFIFLQDFWSMSLLVPPGSTAAASRTLFMALSGSCCFCSKFILCSPCLLFPPIFFSLSPLLCLSHHLLIFPPPLSFSQAVTAGGCLH